MLPDDQQPAGSTTPVEIELDRTGQRLRLVWSDGQRSDFSWDSLRWNCPCALCSGEGGHPGTLASRTSLRSDEVEMIDVDLVGRYAVQPTWRDGHDTGIFTFRNLRGWAERSGWLAPADQDPAS